MLDSLKPLSVYQQPQENTSPIFARAFARGCGGIVRDRYVEGRWSGFGSPQNWHELQRSIEAGFDWYYGDHAYFRRGTFYRVTKNALFSRGVGKSDMQRVKMFLEKPASWGSGENIIICPQSDTFFRRVGTTQIEWITNTVKELKRYTDRKILLHFKKDRLPLSAFLKGAHCVVSYSSNSAVEAVMNGVPAINTADSHAALMCRSSLSDIENLFFPDNRLEYAAVLADNQFTFEEMSNGTCWRHLEGIENAKV